LQEGSLEETLERMEVNLQKGRLEEALKELPDEYRQVIVLRYINELRPQEIASITGETENTVSVRINRGIKKLRGHLAAENA
jgi:RNA polymerase sigma-70 factor (ECF subfamily)